jgi:hypothetical protein
MHSTFPMRALLWGIAATLLLLLGVGTTIAVLHQVQNHIVTSEAILDDALAALERTDESMSHAARLAALTGDDAWEARYRQAAGELRTAVAAIDNVAEDDGGGDGRTAAGAGHRDLPDALGADDVDLALGRVVRAVADGHPATEFGVVEVHLDALAREEGRAGAVGAEEEDEAFVDLPAGFAERRAHDDVGKSVAVDIAHRQRAPHVGAGDVGVEHEVRRARRARRAAEIDLDEALAALTVGGMAGERDGAHQVVVAVAVEVGGGDGEALVGHRRRDARRHEAGESPEGEQRRGGDGIDHDGVGGVFVVEADDDGALLDGEPGGQGCASASCTKRRP